MEPKSFSYCESRVQTSAKTIYLNIFKNIYFKESTGDRCTEYDTRYLR